MRNTSGGLNRKVDVSVYFGKSNVEVKAVESVSKEEYKATINYNGLAVTFDYTEPARKYHMYVRTYVNIIILLHAPKSVRDVYFHYLAY